MKSPRDTKSLQMMVSSHAGQRLVEAEFQRVAALLDEAGLGPSDYLYAALKRAQRLPENKPLSLTQAVLKNKNLLEALRCPPAVPAKLRPAPIVMATSYSVSRNHLDDVAATFQSGEVSLCEMQPGTYDGVRQLMGSFVRLVVAFGPAIILALRARSTLRSSGVDSRYCDLAAVEALRHRIYKQTAQAIIRRTKPKCIVIGNANRPIELGMWSVAKGQNISTVLLPYQEINLKPGRSFSLCRGDFDLVLTFSHYSADQFRRLKSDSHVIAAGYPQKFRGYDATNESLQRTPRILYLGGKVIEEEAAPILRDALNGVRSLQFCIRTHPRMDEITKSNTFGWLPPENFSDGGAVDLSEDIGRSQVVITVRSTAVLRALLLGLPVIWLTPPAWRDALETNSLRKQGLVVAEASNAAELRSLAERIAYDQKESKRIVAKQHELLSRLGYLGDYFGTVKAAIRAQAGLNAPLSGRQPV